MTKYRCTECGRQFPCEVEIINGSMENLTLCVDTCEIGKGLFVKMKLE